MSNENYSKCIIAIQKIKDKIKRMRRSGLAKGGEYSIENLTFKVLRRSGYIEELYNLNQIAYNQLRSIE
jgi:hypothetical protein